MGFIGSLFNALSSIPAILGYVESFAAAVTLWYVQRQTSQTLASIADAADSAASATTDEERFNALQKWKTALSSDRITSS